MRAVTALILVTASVLAVAPAHALRGRPQVEATGCPADNRYIRAVIQGALSDTEERIAMGLLYVSPDRLRLLESPADSAVCQALLSKIQLQPLNYPEHVVRYALYEADGYYFVGTMVYTADGKPVYRPGFLYVLDSAMNEVFSSLL